MCRSRGDAVIGGGSPPASPGCLPGLCSNIWFWRCTTGILAVVSVLILCIHLAVNSSSGKGSSGSPPPEPCPADWLYHQRKCYCFSEKVKDWNSSQSFCASHNSSLIVIESQQELKFIMKITKQDPWIGLRKTGEEFHWVNGTPLDTSLPKLSQTLEKPKERAPCGPHEERLCVTSAY
ncbi:C-type lectin domain family 2 member L isoform X3 [Chelonia mydas]|uniref:C-type lectin domain family 2 member L isoform X3 n=1 Tax=Chelonia mydas TaxID=8469 RepID=UPI001CAA223F|nr:C-type lectin domain family 2 member L isoform X3 [Chelonia mydas]